MVQWWNLCKFPLAFCLNTPLEILNSCLSILVKCRLEGQIKSTTSEVLLWYVLVINKCCILIKFPIIVVFQFKPFSWWHVAKQLSVSQSQALLGVYCILKRSFSPWANQHSSSKIPDAYTKVWLPSLEKKREERTESIERGSQTKPLFDQQHVRRWGESLGDVSAWAAPNHILHTAPRQLRWGMPISKITKHHLTATFIIMMS